MNTAPERVGAIAYRLKGGVLEVLLVSSRRDGSWGVPQGRRDPGLGSAEACASLALKEAGVVGQASSEALATFCERRGRRVSLHGLCVSRELRDWPQRGLRRRRWFPREEAQARVVDAGLAEVIGAFVPELNLALPAPFRPRPRGGPRVVCLDFDDTLCGPTGLPMPGALAATARLGALGVRRVVSSARFSPIYGELNRFRAEKVRRWLDEAGIEVEAISLEVPDADVYVDDRGHSFCGTWKVALAELEGRLRLGQGTRASLSVSLAGALREAGGAPRVGALAAFERLHTLGVRLHVSLGNQRRPAATWPERVAEAQAWLRVQGLDFARAQAEKISSDLYLDERELFFPGDWEEVLPELLERLELPA